MRYPNMTMGRIEAVINKLGGEEGIDRFLAGDSEITIKRHMINTNLQPHRDDEFFGISKHQALRDNSGLLEWNPKKIDVHIPNLREVLSGLGQVERYSCMPLLNACVRDYLLKYPDLLPREWIGKILCFGGTIFRDRKRVMYVPTLEYKAGAWTDVYYNLSMKFADNMAFLIVKQ